MAAIFANRSPAGPIQAVLAPFSVSALISASV